MEQDISSLSREQCADLLGRLLARLLTTDERAATNDATSTDGDKLLTIEQTMTLLACKKPYLYRNAKRLGLAVKLGDGTLRFSFLACQRFIARSTAVVPHTRGARLRA